MVLRSLEKQVGFRSMGLELDGLAVVCALYVLPREVVSVLAVLAFAG